MTCRYGLFFIVLVVTLTSCTRVEPVLDIPVEIVEIEMYSRADRDGLISLHSPIQYVEPLEELKATITPGTTPSIDKIEVRFTNSSDYDIIVSSWGYPQVEIDEYWTFVMPSWLNWTDWRLLAMIHPNSHGDVRHVDMYNYFGALPAGVYRLVYSVEPDIGHVEVTFVLEEATYSRYQDQSGQSPLRMTLVTRPNTPQSNIFFVRFENRSNTDFTESHPLILETRVNDGWVRVHQRYAIHDVLMHGPTTVPAVFANAPTYFVVDMRKYGNLESGHYRFIYHGFFGHYSYVEFKLRYT